LHNVGKLARIFFLIVAQAHQRCLHDINAGDILGNRETIGIFLGQALKILDDVEKITRRDVASLRGYRSTRATGAPSEHHEDRQSRK
jgi:hypothetical protein